MISMLFKGGQACPIFVCEVCGDMIADIEEGRALHVDAPPEDRIENRKFPVVHVHTDRCEKLFRAKQAEFGKALDYQPLGLHFYYLGANLEVDGQRLNQLKPAQAKKR